MKSVKVKIDGYSVKERLLEGVMFNVLFTLNEDYSIEDVTVSPSSNSDTNYLKRLGSVDMHSNDVRDWVLDDPYNILIEQGDEQGVLSDEEIEGLEKHRPSCPKPVAIVKTNLMSELFDKL